MTLDNYESAYAHWLSSEGISLDEEDSRDGIALYLRRNPGFCFVALVDGRLVGTVLCGHEGCRGILRHLAVEAEYRCEGIAGDLVDHIRSTLARDGIRKCYTFVLDSNVAGLRFWEHMGWRILEDDFRLMQIPWCSLFSSGPEILYGKKLHHGIYLLPGLLGKVYNGEKFLLSTIVLAHSCPL